MPTFTLVGLLASLGAAVVAAQQLPPNPPTPTPTPVGPINPVVVRGNFLYDAVTHERFFAKGVAYNPRNTHFAAPDFKTENTTCVGGTPTLAKLEYSGDVIADGQEELWRPALTAIADAGANVIRLYNIDPELGHARFMDAAAALGIYVIVPLTRHNWGFLPAGSPSPSCYAGRIPGYGNVGANLLTSAKLIVKQFSNWTNVLAFNVANELTVATKTGYAAYPCVKALTRDIHRYQAECASSMRKIPLMYSDMDMGAGYRLDVAEYLTCSLESDDDAIDMFGLNVYSWCEPAYPGADGKDDFTYSPYYPIQQEFKAFGKPLIFAEFGCNEGGFKSTCPYSGGRTWPQVQTFFNQFSEILSGAIAFEFSMEQSEFGLALTPGFLEGQDELYLLPDYYALQTEFKKYSVAPTWNGGPAWTLETVCSWVPTHTAPLSQIHQKAVCPTPMRVQAIFKGNGLKGQPNWASLPPSPEGADQDELADCPEYQLTAVEARESSCGLAIVMPTPKASSPAKPAGAAVAATATATASQEKEVEHVRVDIKVKNVVYDRLNAEQRLELSTVYAEIISDAGGMSLTDVMDLQGHVGRVSMSAGSISVSALVGILPETPGSGILRASRSVGSEVTKQQFASATAKLLPYGDAIVGPIDVSVDCHAPTSGEERLLHKDAKGLAWLRLHWRKVALLVLAGIASVAILLSLIAGFLYCFLPKVWKRLLRCWLRTVNPEVNKPPKTHVSSVHSSRNFGAGPSGYASSMSTTASSQAHSTSPMLLAQASNGSRSSYTPIPSHQHGQLPGRSQTYHDGMVPSRANSFSSVRTSTSGAIGSIPGPIHGTSFRRPVR